jgi:hypothetical protein
LQQTLGNQGVYSRVDAGLRINDVNDPSEKEADRVAAAVMEAPGSEPHIPAVATSPAAAVQRKCASCAQEDDLTLQRKESPPPQIQSAPPIVGQVLNSSGQSQIHRKCTECEEEDKRTLQTKALGTARSADVAPSIVHEVLRSPGQPFDARTRAFFEPRFGHDFSKVRVHTDSRAADSARAVNALAYTVGSHLAFADGQYAPATQPGMRLLAHTAQNSGGVQIHPMR